MKNLLKVFVAVLILVSFTSCEKDKGDSAGFRDFAFEGKWEVNGESDYNSFEFTVFGNYIVTSEGGYNNQFGIFNVVDENTVDMVDFGGFKAASIEDDNMNFSVELDSDPGNTLFFQSTRVESNSNSSRTALFCRTWRIIEMAGETLASDEQPTVLFSSAGTYFVKYSYDEEGELGNWTWNNNESAFCYSWGGTAICNGSNEVKIEELTSSRLVLSENPDGYEYRYVCQAVTNSKSTILNSSTNIQQSKVPKGFLKR